MDEPRRHAWEDVVDDEIRQISANYAGRIGLRQRPALLCIDNYNAVFGDRPEPALEGMKRFPSTCGLAAWDAIEPTQRLMAAARSAGIPIIHTTTDDQTQSATSRAVSTKRASYGAHDRAWSHTTFPPLAPEPGELVIRKTRASGFYGTALSAHLVQMGIDTLIACGNSTSGCVRATVVEGYMHGYRMGVVEECVFDRNWLSHKVNLYDMDLKYADVLFLDEVLQYLQEVVGAPEAAERVEPALAH